MSLISQKGQYENAILKKTSDHKYQSKWSSKLKDVMILWDEVWIAVHNCLSSNKTKTAIWEQLHLNFYTQYSYNIWHKVEHPCTLSNKVPESIYHIILHCDFVNTIWDDIQPVLLQLSHRPISDEEKVLGIVNIKKIQPFRLEIG